MDWRNCSLILWMFCMPLVHCWSTVSRQSPTGLTSKPRHLNEVSPYIDLALCPIRDEPWSCARQQSARILDVWDEELHKQWQKLKIEADQQLNATMEKRGYSSSTLVTKEKPSSILKKIEIGTNYMKEYLSETMDGFMGREYEYMQGGTDNEVEDDDTDENENDTDAKNDSDNENDNDNENENENDSGDEADEADDEEDNADTDDENNGETDNDSKTGNNESSIKNAAALNENASENNEFIEITESDGNGQLKQPATKKKQKNKKKKGQQPATLVVVQPASEHQSVVGHHDQEESGHDSFVGNFGGHGGKPTKQKRKRKKIHQNGGVETVYVEQDGSEHIGLGLLEQLVGVDDAMSGGGKRKRKGHPSNYGRSNGVTRGKKKKKKKALMKLALIGTFLKAKIELLLKILGAHLQIKFFAIALIGLLINIARFWIDVKRGGSPQKVIYVEHAHHQHHYEDHGDDWNEGGGYWKRSLQTDSSIDESSSTDSYHPRPQEAQQLAYRNYWQ